MRAAGSVFSDSHTQAMRAALDAAGHGQRGANPLVGATLLAADGQLVTGFHRGAGHPHAEVEAIAAARAVGMDVAQATLFITLEPCNHVGRTPACTQAIVQAGIRHVVYALADPHEPAAGGGQMLKRHGVRVQHGLLAAEAQALNAGWFAALSAQRPFVTAKIAQSLDGCIAAADGTSQWLTSAASRSQVHQLRAQVDAVIVGTGTALADNPRLTARMDRAAAGSAVPAVQQPTPVVIGKRSLRADSHLARNPATVHFRSHELLPALQQLRASGHHHVLVEGGARLLMAFLSANVVDELYVHIAPLLLGGDGLSTSASLHIPTLGQAQRLALDDRALPAIHTSSGDVIMRYTPLAAQPANHLSQTAEMSL